MPALSIAALALAVALLLGQPLGAFAQDLPSCRGVNMLDEMQGTEAHGRVVAAAAAAENAGTLLWKIEQGDRPPSYLFGTVHLTDDRVGTLSGPLKAALAGSRRLVLEIDDLSPGNVMKAFVRARALMMYPAGGGLAQILNEADFAKVTGILRRAGLPAETAGAFRPWVATMMLAMSECEQARIRSGALPLDAQLARDAQALGITVAGLETLEMQLQALASVPEADQIDILKAALRSYDRIDDILETTVQLYLARQLGAIWPLQLELAGKAGVDPGAFASLEQNLLAARNLGMRQTATSHLDEGGVFIAVGALHLPGRQGLVSLLREAGYTLTPLE